MRTAAEIIDALAAQRGLCVPVTAAFPLSREFCEQAIREAVAEWEAVRAARPEVELRVPALGATTGPKPENP